MSEIYTSRVALLLNCLPYVARQSDFALKGGTAINFFHRSDFPRLSIDIDLTYIPLCDRNTTLNNIEQLLLKIKYDIEKNLAPVMVSTVKTASINKITKLIVKKNGVDIKIEPNLSLRGSVFPINSLSLSNQIAKQYSIYLTGVPVMSYEDCYAGKFCAALDRQHPRDLFDVWMMLERGISENLKNAFIVYLLSNNRPIHELLVPNLLKIDDLYHQEFLGMQLTEVKLETLLKTRLQLIKMLGEAFTKEDREFILSVKSGKPNFDLFPIKHIIHLPGIQWKVLNIQKMDPSKRLEQFKQLSQLLRVDYE